MAYIGNSPANVGNYQVVDDISSTFNGTLTSFALTVLSLAINPAKSGQLLVSINGVLQEPDDTGTSGFKVSGSNIVFSSAPATGSTFWAVWQGQAVDIGTPSDGTVGTDQLSATGTKSGTTYLAGDNTWKTVVTDLVNDTTPQLGGDLDTNGNDVSLGDNVKANFGAGNDLQIYHDGSNSYIKDVGTGDLYIRGNTDLKIQNSTGSTDKIVATSAGAVELYHNGSEKLATTATGVDVTGSVTCDTRVTIDGGTGYASMEIGGDSGGYIDLKAPHSDDYDGRVHYDGAGDGELIITTRSSNSSPVVLKQQDSEKLRTTATGVDVTGSVTCDGFTSTGIDDNATAELLSLNADGNTQFGASVPVDTLRYLDLYNTSTGSSAGALFRMVTSNAAGTGNTTTNIIKYKNSGFLINNNDTASSNFTGFGVAGAERMRITSAGNVGIGTTAPSRLQYGSVDPKLHVNQEWVAGSYNLTARFSAGGDADNTGASILINHSNDRGLLIEAGRGILDSGIAHFGIVNSAGTNTRVMTLNQSGIVTMPYQPAFSANNSNTGVANTTLVFNQANVNVGSHYSESTGRFTAPVGGQYMFTFYGMSNTASNMRVTIQINGAAYTGGEHLGGVGYTNGVTYSQVEINTILTLSASDYVSIFNHPGYSNIHSNHNKFSGYLIG